MLLKQLKQLKGRVVKSSLPTVLTVQVTFKQSSVKYHLKLKNWLRTSKLSTKQSKKQNQLQPARTYVTNLTITTTQGVGIKVDVNSL